MKNVSEKKANNYIKELFKKENYDKVDTFRHIFEDYVKATNFTKSYAFKEFIKSINAYYDDRARYFTKKEATREGEYWTTKKELCEMTRGLFAK